MTVCEYIQSEIRGKGPIPFSRFMQLCLYGEPGSPPGYYAGKREQFGKAGDFYTSSDVHAVYGRLLCRQFEQMWRVLEEPPEIAIVELGPGRGLFAADVLAWADKKLPRFAKALRYELVEVSSSSRERLRERLGDDPRVTMHESTDSVSGHALEYAIVFANEFFDALPTEVLDYRGEVHVSLDGDEFVEQFVAPSSAVREFVKQYGVLPQQGERVDAPLQAQDYMIRVAEFMNAKKGFCVFVDYGYVRDEMLAGRHMGTVTSFRRHTISDSPYDSPGEQDITVQVNFTALAAAAREHGLDPLGWVTQSQFLIGIGEESQFGEAFEECKLPQEHAKRALQLKHLVTPEGMGEAFHVLVLASGVERAIGLDGLKFLRPSNVI
jgi:SAM-dependent MidA family methyltransferase